MRSVPVLLAIFAGCRGVIDPQQTATWNDAGRLCVVPTGIADGWAAGGPFPAQVSFEPGVPLSAVVSFSECEACPSQPTTSCSVTGGDPPLVVESSASYTILEDGDCTTACNILSAVCPVGTLDAGTWSFEHGGDLLVVEIPSSNPDPCAGELAPPVISPEEL